MNPSRTALALLLPALLGTALFLNTLSNEFVLDDIPAVVENRAARCPIDLSQIVTTNYWGDRPDYEHLTIYRPLTTLSYALGDCIHGPRPAGHHATNATLHGIMTALVTALALMLFRRTLQNGRSALAAALGSGLLFAVHPIHTEAVAGIVNRAELLAAIFVCAFMLAGLKYRGAGMRAKPRWAVAATGLFTLALLSKENAVTALPMLPLINLATAIAETRRASLRALLGRRGLLASWPLILSCGAVLIGYLALRTAFLPATLSGAVPPFDNPIVETTGLIRLLSPFVVYLQALTLLFAPYGLSVDYTAFALPTATGALDPRALAGLGLFLLTIATGLVAARRRPDVALAIALFLAAYSVVSHLAFPATVIFAERLLYLPSVGFCLLAGSALSEALARAPRGVPRALVVFLGLATLLGGALITLARNAEWRDEATLFAHSLARTPGSSRLWSNFGLQLARQQHLEAARNAFERAVEIDERNFAAWSNLAATELQLGEYGAAKNAVRAALTRKPDHAGALLTLCRLRLADERRPEALYPCRAAVERAPTHLPARFSLVLALLNAGLRQEALGELSAIERDFPHSREAAWFTKKIRQKLSDPDYGGLGL